MTAIARTRNTARLAGLLRITVLTARPAGQQFRNRRKPRPPARPGPAASPAQYLARRPRRSALPTDWVGTKVAYPGTN